MAADHVIVQADDEHDVVEPAGAVAPSMKTAALVVAGEMYAGLRTLLDARFGRGMRIVIVPLAVALRGAAVAAGLPPGCATALKPAGLPLEPPPAQPLRTVTTRRPAIPSAGR
jgi:hypothetical protein